MKLYFFYNEADSQLVVLVAGGAFEAQNRFVYFLRQKFNFSDDWFPNVDEWVANEYVIDTVVNWQVDVLD